MAVPSQGSSIRHALTALSLANLCFLRVWAELFTVAGPGGYFLNVSSQDFLSACVGVFLLATLFFFARWVLVRLGGERGRRVVHLAFLATLLVLATQVGSPESRGLRGLLQLLQSAQAFLLVVPLALLGVVAWRPRKAVAFAVQGLLMLVPGVGLNFARAGWCVLRYAPSAQLSARTPPIGTALPETPGPRVVVILFDALDRRIAFDDAHTILGQELPSLARFRSESVDATNVTRTASKTRKAIPALLTGEAVAEATPLGPADLGLHLGSPIREARLSEVSTIFDEAKSAGGSAVAVGWYHPYCRVFEELDACAWHASTSHGGSHGQETGFAHVLADQLATVFPSRAKIQRGSELHVRLVDAAAIAVRSGGAGLVWLHVDVPHAPYIWDRARSTFRSSMLASSDGYLDNLVLADRVFARLRLEMETAGKWDDTSVLVTADHGIRGSTFGAPDTRVPFFLKLPGQSTGITVDAPLSALLTHDLVVELLHDRIHTPSEAEAWLLARKSTVAIPDPVKDPPDD